MAYPVSSQDMVDLDGLLGTPVPAATEGAGSAHESSAAPHRPAFPPFGQSGGGDPGVDLAKHPSGIIPTLQYKH